MPLDFTAPRADPTIGRKKVPPERIREVRDQFPVTTIVTGLRRVGGYADEFDDRYQRQVIDRYKRDLDGGNPQPAPPPVSPADPLWREFTDTEVERIVHEMKTKSDFNMVRPLAPSHLRVIRRHDLYASELQVSEGNAYISTFIGDEEMLKNNAHMVVRHALHQAWVQLRTDVQNQSPTRVIKPITH